MTTQPKFRIVFPSYDWDDSWLVNQIINRPIVVGREEVGFIKGVPAEEGLTDPDAIEDWIRRNMEGYSCLILFVGEKTYQSDWVKFELLLAREKLMARFIVHLDGMRRKDGSICGYGVDPYGYHGLYTSGPGYQINQYHWVSNNGAENIGEWIEEACLRAGK